jgi:hypothetical protein
LSVSGRALAFPTEPMFLCDFHPESLPYLVPPDAIREGLG